MNKQNANLNTTKLGLKWKSTKSKNNKTLAGPNFHDNNAQTTASNLQTLLDQLSKLIFVLVSQSFVVSVQPEPVLKTQHKFMTEVGTVKNFQRTS